MTELKMDVRDYSTTGEPLQAGSMIIQKLVGAPQCVIRTTPGWFYDYTEANQRSLLCHKFKLVFYDFV